jgi:hypothetical protein
MQTQTKAISAGDQVVLQDSDYVGFALNEARDDRDAVAVRWGDGNESKHKAAVLVKV